MFFDKFKLWKSVYAPTSYNYVGTRDVTIPRRLDNRNKQGFCNLALLESSVPVQLWLKHPIVKAKIWELYYGFLAYNGHTESKGLLYIGTYST